MELNINPINTQDIKRLASLKQNETEMPASSVDSSTVPVYEKTPESKNLFEVYKANRLAQLPVGYKKIETFEAPYIGKSTIYQLDNGHKVVIIPKPGPTVVKTFVQVGSSNEPDKINGISHLIEHNIFNGSSKYAAGEFDKIISKTGAFANAVTSRSETQYYLEYSLQNKEDFEKLIDLYADTIQNPNFSEDMIEKEKDIVLSEKSYRENIEILQLNLLMNRLFNINPKREGLIGTQQSIKNITREDIQNYYNTWYTPDNMTTVIVGDVDPTSTIKLFSKYFNKKSKENMPPENKYYLSLNDTIKSSKRYDTKFSINGKVNMYMAFVGPKSDDIKDRISTMALMQVISDDNYSGVKKEVEPYTKNLAMDMMNVSSYIHDPRILFLAADFEPNEEEGGLKAVYSTINKLSQETISDKELETLKTKLKTSFSMNCEDSHGVADMAGSSLINCGDVKCYTEVINQIDALTPDDIKIAAQKYLDLNRNVIIMAHPRVQYNELLKSSGKTKDNLSFSGNTNQINMGHIKEYNLSNNLHVVFDTTPGTAVGTVNFEIKNDLLKSKPGTAEILQEMINQSQRKYLLDQYNDIANINDMNPDINVTNSDMNSFTFCEPKKVPVLLNRIRDCFYNPDLSQDNFNEAKALVKSELPGKTYTPADMVLEEFYKDSPNGYSNKTILNNIDNVNLNDVVGLYRNLISNVQGNVVISMPQNNLTKLQGQIFGSLEQGFPVYQEHKNINTFDSPPLEKNKVLAATNYNKKAEIVQAFKIKESGNAKDMMAVNLISMILGGYHKSRLFQDLREDQQLAYIVNSHYYSNGRTGELLLKVNTTTEEPINGVLKIRNDNIQKVLEGYKKHINSLINEPVSQEELDGAKLVLKNEIIKNIETSYDRNYNLKDSLNLPYGIDSINEYLKAIDAITPQDIQKAAVLFLDKPSVIVVNANKDAIERNKDYLSDFGEVSQVQ